MPRTTFLISTLTQTQDELPQLTSRSATLDPGADRFGCHNDTHLLDGARLAFRGRFDVWMSYQRGWLTEGLRHITAIYFAIPATVLTAASGSNQGSAIIAVSSWPICARWMCGQTLTGAPDIPVAEPDVEVDRDLGWVVVDDTGGDVNVIIHNDDVTPMDFVVAVLRSVFGVGGIKAQGIMLTAHYRGQAYVCTLPRETAKDRVGRAHGLARQAGYPLTFSIEDSA